MTKKYKLKCFGCGNLIESKKEAAKFRIASRPYCGECFASYCHSDEEIYYQEQFDKRFPTDQDYIDYKNIEKYGEC